MRPSKEASHETMGEEGRLVATSSATYFQTKAGKSSQMPPTRSITMLRDDGAAPGAEHAEEAAEHARLGSGGPGEG